MSAETDTIKAQALANIAAITLAPKPSYSIDGQSISWTEYLKSQQDLVAWCDLQAARDQGPYELQTRTIGG